VSVPTVPIQEKTWNVMSLLPWGGCVHAIVWVCCRASFGAVIKI